MKIPAILVLEDGSVFYGDSIGANGTTVGELVFNTSMTGYQEILTDPSYCRQIVTLTYPHIGNTGINSEDEEAGEIAAAGLVIRDLPLAHSSWRSENALDHYLKERNIIALAGIDTRRLTRILRHKGAQAGCIVTGADADITNALATAKAFPGLKGMDLAKSVTTRVSYEWNESIWDLSLGYQAKADLPYHVVAYDFGIKRNILRLLVSQGCKVTVVPADTPVGQVLAMNPQGVFLSNGPGDPEPCKYAISAIQKILEHKIPIFGICLGHQLLALASGAKTVKMKFGHHGANHPVQDIETGEVMITSQNHGFAVDESSMPASLEITHRSLFDQSVQGMRRNDVPAFSFQGHPEASPGPRDVEPLFKQFVAMMASRSAVNNA